MLQICTPGQANRSIFVKIACLFCFGAGPMKKHQIAVDIIFFRKVQYETGGDSSPGPRPFFLSKYLSGGPVIPMDQVSRIFNPDAIFRRMKHKILSFYLYDASIFSGRALTFIVPLLHLFLSFWSFIKNGSIIRPIDSMDTVSPFTFMSCGAVQCARSLLVMVYRRALFVPYLGI